MDRRSLSMVSTAYNEEDALEPFVRKAMTDLASVSDDYELVLVNDGSTDRTLEIATWLHSEFPRLKIVDLGRRVGTGLNYPPGFSAASKEIVVNQTVDLFYDSADLPRLLEPLDRADSVSGYRLDLSSNSLLEKIFTLGNVLLIRILFPQPRLQAYQTVQAHRRSFFDRIEFESRSPFISPELLIKAHRLGKTICEIPLTYHPRRIGRSKGGKLRQISGVFRDAFRLWFRWNVLRRPIHKADDGERRSETAGRS